MDDERFWMVWCPEGRAPTVKHDSYERAVSEAERLARANPGREFFVLQATDMRCVNDMVRKRLCDGIPF